MRKCKFLTDTKIVKIFICGPTVYDYTHLGHARLFLFYDIMARYFIFKEFHPIVIVNITDIDPKIYSKARMQGIYPRELATKFTEELLVDISLLGIGANLNFAKASDYVDFSIKIIKDLLRNNLAYSTNGNVFLDTASLTSYGKLSRMTRWDIDNARLDIEPGKRNPSDILLWNASDELDEKYFDEILGGGIPWWHIQDSSIAMSNFDGHYDIHGGAVDLVYPHHESHLAQLQVLTSSQRPVKYWNHVGLLTLGAKKMSKTLENTISIRDILKKYNSNILRLYLFSNHYRSPFEFSLSKLDNFRDIDEVISNAFIYYGSSSRASESNTITKKYLKKFITYMEDDFDTPRALEIMIKAAKSDNSIVALKDMVNIFGLRY